MKRTFLRRAAWGVSFAVLLAAVTVLGWLHFRQPRASGRTYRIGWQVSPPYQLSDGGTATGLAVDLVREAARRRGIDLEWVFWRDSSESALMSKAVDLWPLITITPERLKVFHITEPYAETEHAIIVRADSPYWRVQDLAAATIALANFSFEDRLLRGRLPGARSLSRPTTQRAIADTCEQRADGAFMDVYTAIATLLEQQVCAGHPLRWIALPEMRSRLGVGATFEARAVADALREEIGTMAREGRLPSIVGKWGFTPEENLESMEQLVDARRHVVRLAAVAILFALLLVLACWQTVRVTRERNRARQAGLALRAAEQKLRLMANNLKEMVLAYDMSRKLIYANPAVETLTGYSVAELERAGFVPWIHPDDRSRMLGYWEGLFHGGGFHQEEYRLVAKDGRVKWAAAIWGPLLDEAGRQVGVQGSERDITEHHALQEQYLQAQKLESIGRLAGGVAHDFNNLLTVINGYGDLVLRQLNKDDPLRDSVVEIRKAGERAKDLTQQLLAFSRKQLSEPRVVDLNGLINENLDMLQRLVGEDIEVVTELEPGLGLVVADRSQLHQVLMNLVVNARDATPGRGRLTLRTANVDVDGNMAAEHPEIAAGPFVLLAVSDTGMGIKEGTSQHIFDPFFTTKGEGEGTGLGLSLVYGIVRQSGGTIAVHSEPNHGATFSIYLPRTKGLVAEDAGVAAPRLVLSGSETVLVVEDQAAVRRFIVSVLSNRGYQVLEAAMGDDALLAAERHNGPIHLLLTDVIMPGMTGKELAERLTKLRPEMRVLYMSGYAADIIAHRGLLEPGILHIAKPFAPDALAAKVREVLEPVKSARILVVDDEDGIRQFFRKVLADAGYEVSVAGGGEQALTMARAQKYQVVITDLVMPDQEGIETIRIMRKEQPELRIIATSGAFGGTFLKAAKMLGADSTLAKPVSSEQLLAAVCGLLA